VSVTWQSGHINFFSKVKGNMWPASMSLAKKIKQFHDEMSKSQGTQLGVLQLTEKFGPSTGMKKDKKSSGMSSLVPRGTPSQHGERRRATSAAAMIRDPLGRKMTIEINDEQAD